MVSAPAKPNGPTGDQRGPNIPPQRGFRQRGGRPGLNVDFRTVCDAVQDARNGSGETMEYVAGRSGVSRGWLWNWCCPALQEAE